MKTYNYNWEVKNLVTLFINAINDVVIKRYNEDKSVEDQIHVNALYMPKNRALHDIVNKNQHLQLPIISCWIGNLQRDNNRVFNNIQGSYYNITPSVSGFEHMLQPLPVDLTMNMSIIARFQTDIDQIIDNILVNFDPYITVSYEVPHFPQEVRSTIHWNQNCNLEYPTDINNTQPYRVIGNTSFVIKGWLFKPPQSPVGKIYKIDTSFIAVSTIYSNYSLLSGLQNQYNTDEFIISGRPFVNKVIPERTIRFDNTEFMIKGDMFNFTEGIYVSGSTFPLSSYTFIDNFSANGKLSGAYPGFSAIPISSWNIESNNILTFTIPPAVSAGYFNIILYNQAGYGSIMIDSRSNTLNPYPSSMPEYSTWQASQPNYISGVQVF